jgi:glycosyltransferase, family 1
MNIIVIATNLNRKELWGRWLYLKDRFENFNITILAPARFEVGNKKGYTYGKKLLYTGNSYQEDRFQVIPINVKQNILGDWYSDEIAIYINKIKPDFVYYIGIHSSYSLYQAIEAGHREGAKVCVFTMRGDLQRTRPKSIKQVLLQQFPKYLNKRNVANSDAIFVHYPDAIKAFKDEGYKGPLYINTQIGVDTSFFKFNLLGREKIRKELGLEDCYVFGGASRFNEEKGILDVIKALPQNPKIKYMILGGGTKEDIDRIKSTAEKYKVSDQIVMPGMIPWDSLCDYLSAMDCAVHVPRRTNTWVETFSLALVQEMSVGLPVIGSKSGSVPYQIGDDTYLVSSGNIGEIKEKMHDVMGDRIKAGCIGEKNRQRCIDCFDIKRLAFCLGTVLTELNEGVYNKDHVDTAQKWE